MNTPLTDEHARVTLEKLLTTRKGREDILVAMQGLMVDAIVGAEKGFWPNGNLEGLRRLKDYSKKLMNIATREGDDPTYGRHLLPPDQIRQVVDQFCAHCGMQDVEGDLHDPNICTVRLVLSQ